MSTDQTENFETSIDIPDKVTVTLKKNMLAVSGPLGKTIKMKVVYAHFPITVKTKDTEVIIENFQGERAARKAKIHGQTKVVVKGDDIILTGPVLSEVSQSAAEIEQKSKIKNKDHRVFLDGIYIYSKSKGIGK